MPTQVSLQPESVFDPRGDFLREPTGLAPRLGGLDGKAIVLFDNARVTQYTAIYGPLYRWLAEDLNAQGATVSDEVLNLLQASSDGVVALAEKIAQSGVDGVVIALCKGGVTMPSSVFASELERRGIPCVQICTQVGYPLAVATASSLTLGLPIVKIELATGEGDAFGRAEVDAIFPDIVAGLTEDRSVLLERFREKFPSSAAPRSADGRIEQSVVTAEGTVSEGNTSVSVSTGRFARDLYEQWCESRMCDGLPVIPPTEEFVDEMLAFTDLAPDFAFVAELPPSGAAVTVRSLAVNAVMAGCKPEYFPILVAAAHAIADPAYRVFQSAITTFPGGNAIVVSGPLVDKLGINSGAGCLGPGFRANATIGRALSMTIVNVSRAFPGESDLSTFGSASEFTYCFGESDANNPWTPLHTDLYGPDVTSVTVHKCEGPHNVLAPRVGGPEKLLRIVADTAATLGGNNLVHLGQMLVLLNPAQAAMIERAGWSKRDVKEFLFETARHPREVLQRREPATLPAHFMHLDEIPVLRSPDDVIVVVAGGGGGFAMVGLPWGLSQAISRPVVLKDGTPVTTIERPR